MVSHQSSGKGEVNSPGCCRRVHVSVGCTKIAKKNTHYSPMRRLFSVGCGELEERKSLENVGRKDGGGVVANSGKELCWLGVETKVKNSIYTQGFKKTWVLDFMRSA